MKPTLTLISAVIALTVITGCASNHSPVQPMPPSMSNGATLATATSIGAGVGAALSTDENRGVRTAGGAALGLLTGAFINKKNNSAAQAEAEAFERGRREARLEVMQKYWHDNTLSPSADEQAKPAAKKPIEYPPGYYEGIKFGPRTSSDGEVLKEPKR